MRVFIRHFKIYFFSSIIMLALMVFTRIVLLRTNGAVLQEDQYFEGNAVFLFYSFLIFFSSGILGLISSSIDVFILKKILHRKSLAKVFLIGITVQLVLLLGFVASMNRFVMIFLAKISGEPAVEMKKGEVAILIVFLVFSIVFAKAIIEIDRKLGPGNLRKMAMGKFYHPKEEDRIFMFIDLKDSTTIAETLGHFKYSLFIQDCFRDLTVVDKHGAEIYQYVGDEVVLSWPVKKVKNFELFLSAFFAFMNALEERRKHYEMQYGVFPIFKAGAHSGLSIVTEVGEIKRSISYHGDTINTTARIQGKCNELNSQLLISGSLHNQIKKSSIYRFRDAGLVALKGKLNNVQIYRIEE